jgi:mono/diheme cytochrome c family protein
MNQFSQTTKGLAIAALLLSGCKGFAGSEAAQDKSSHIQAASADSAVTPVIGESWLHHLNRPFGETSMGRTWRLGPAPADEATLRLAGTTQDVAAKAANVKGSDLYRLNCQGCHGEFGQGAPPEINSVINPVRATSMALIMERMKNTGMDISRADAATLAQQSHKALLQRLHNGGESMPAFPHLSETEIRSLVTYLGKLAGVPGTEREGATVKESAVRVGELIVKSTCHTCHSAVGPDPTPQQLMDGAIPPLNTLTTRKSQPEFIRKVTQGAPIFMGAPPSLCRGRMPVFYYLNEEEAADVYLYLTQYPPSEDKRSEAAIALSQGAPGSSSGGTAPPNGSSPNIGPPDSSESESSVDTRTIAVSLVVVVVFGLLAGGLGFTVWEFRRLSAASADANLARYSHVRPKVARPRIAAIRLAGALSAEAERGRS